MQNKILCILLHRVFHGIRLLRLIKIGCRETINFFCDYFQLFRLLMQDVFLGVITFFIKNAPRAFGDTGNILIKVESETEIFLDPTYF